MTPLFGAADTSRLSGAGPAAASAKPPRCSADFRDCHTLLGTTKRATGDAFCALPVLLTHALTDDGRTTPAMLRVVMPAAWGDGNGHLSVNGIAQTARGHSGILANGSVDLSACATWPRLGLGRTGE